jgi:hypothetical protein
MRTGVVIEVLEIGQLVVPDDLVAGGEPEAPETAVVAVPTPAVEASPGLRVAAAAGASAKR